MKSSEAINQIKVLLGLQEAEKETTEVETTVEETPAAEPAPEVVTDEVKTEEVVNFAKEEDVNSLKDTVAQYEQKFIALNQELANTKQAATQIISLLEQLMATPEADPSEVKKDGLAAERGESKKDAFSKIQNAFSELKNK